MKNYREDSLSYVAKLFDDVRAMSADGPGVTRQGFSSTESEVLERLTEEGRRLGLEIRTDDAGSVWMTLPGKNRSLPAFVSGSHADSVPQGGNFDGLAGIVAAIETARRLKHDAVELERDFTILMMRCEESSFFGKAYAGSLGMMGRLKPSDLALRHRTTGETLGESIRNCGLDPDRLTTGIPVIDPSRIAAFVELHIEQGPTLDSDPKVRTGIVTGIRGNIRHKMVRVVGETAHSGAVDKAYRHDALLAACRLLSRMDDLWDERLAAGDDLVFTSGVFRTGDNAAISVIPGEVTFTVDIRSLDEATLEHFHDQLKEQALAIGRSRGVEFIFDDALRTAPAKVDGALADKLATAASRAGLPVRRLASGAGHDAAMLGNCGIPTAMIFVANQNGSHNPREAMKLEDFLAGVDVLTAAVTDFDRH